MEYLLKSSAILIIFYTFYKLFLQKETIFQPIRIYFQIGFLTALIVPMIIIPKYVYVDAFSISDNLLQVQNNQIITNSAINTNQIMAYLYLTGVLIFTIRLLIQLGSVIWFIYSQQKIKYGKYYLIKTHKNIAPFSFFNYIVYNDNNYDQTELFQILTHEKAHSNQLHSIDIILSNIITTILWFNPFAWLYKKEVQNNLEYIADEHAQYFSKEKQNYQYLLLKTSLPDYQLALTNNFYNSLIKKRINMLQKNRSKNLMQIKFALIIPVLMAFIFTFNTKVIAQQKQVKTVEIQSDYEVEVITKDFQKSDLENLKNKFSKNNVTLKYSKLKYNDNNEIISINLNVKNNKGNQSSLSQNGNEPIKSIRIKINNDTGALSLGNFSEHALHENVFFSSNDDKIHKKIIIEKDGDHDMIFISGDSTKVIKHKGDGYVFISDDEENGNVEKHVIKVKNDGKTSNVWISKDGDTTKMKKIEIIEIDEDDDHGTTKVIVKSKNTKKGENVMFYKSDGKDPLIILDGKEITKEKMEAIKPENIKTMNVLKGEMAIKKYGEKAKDGVIEIKTKK